MRDIARRLYATKVSPLISGLRKRVSTQLIDPRNYQPELPLPEGFGRQQIHDILTSVTIDESAKGELFGYASSDLERFLRTLDLVPDNASGKLLEIGANPYFTTLLLRNFRPALDLSLINYFGSSGGESRQSIVFPGFGGKAESFDLSYQNANIETDQLPYPDAAFDYLLFCEVLEHLTHDPLRALLELKRVMKPNASMILTTPNAARLENVVAFVEGRNMYDPYSAYGPYGRHNREYTRHELHLLMEHCGFEAEISFTANVHPDIPPTTVNAAAINAVLSQVRHREHDLGQYFFTRWRNTRPANEKLPAWLYRSYPDERVARQ